MEFLRRLFSSDGFHPHGPCYLWKPELIWLHVISDALIFLAYMSIAVTLVHFVRKRRDLLFNWMFLCFGTFIVACGLTHAIEVRTIWVPWYWFSGGVKAVTAVASVGTAILLVRLVRGALALASPEHLKTANQTEEGVLVPSAIRDITERKRAEANQRASEEKFRAVAEHLNDAIVSADSEAKISYFNRAAERAFGYSAADTLGKPLTLLMPDRFQDAHRRGFQRFLSTGEARVIGKTVELTGIRKDGSEFPLELSLTTWKASEGTFFTAIIRDITERKRAEEAMARQAAELSRSNAELAATNRELEAFSYSVSHDLRAPLRHIDGFARILLEDCEPQLDALAQRHLQRIRDATAHMGRLVDDLLNLSRIGRREVNKQVVSLNSLVEEVLVDLKPEMEGRQIDWQIGRLPFVECDPALIRQALANLLSNALKYTRPRECAVIEVGQTTVDGQSAIFVRDNGVGFSMKYADKLFGVFQRLHRQEDFEGTGVGLATVQRIIHKHGGRVWAEAELDRGATFYFILDTVAGNAPEGRGREMSTSWQKEPR